jgi:hypothetical protein
MPTLMWRQMLPPLLVCVLLFRFPAAAAAQPHEHDPAAQPQNDQAAAGWKWQADARVFFGLNHQDRKFRDFSVWESQNWMMGTGERSVGRARLQLISMFSLEPWTLRDIGSPQTFQTGETFQRAALIDYQHPHDLLMALGSQLRMPAGRTMLLLGLDVVGNPTLGPVPFMHRPSAEPNPQTPLAHHHFDSTHATPGVVRLGVEASAWRLEGSVFRGREPDENRHDLDLGALDSYAVRLAWSRGPWSAQASSGWLNEPEFVTPYDSTRLTASVAYERPNLAWMAGFAQNREIHGNLEAYLAEASWRMWPRDTLYTRVESVAKDILDVGFHPVNTFHRHRQSLVGAATLGYVRELFRGNAGAIGIGADITGYSVPANLRESYGSPLSYHAFVKYRLGPSTNVHVH